MSFDLNGLDLGNFLNCTRRKQSFDTESDISLEISEPILTKY